MLNLSVLQGLHSVKPPDLIGRMRTLADLQNTQRQGQVDDLKIQEAQRQAAQGKALHDALIESGGDIEAALPKIAQIAPELYPHYKQIVDEDKQQGIQNALTARKAQFENANAVNGQEAPGATVSMPVAQPSTYPGQVGAFEPNTPAGTQGVDIGLPAQEISGIPQLGVAATKVQPQSLFAQRKAQDAKRQQELQDKITLARETQKAERDFTTVNPPIPPRLTFEEQTAADWLKRNPGKTLSDYQDMDANRKRPTTTINNGSNTVGDFNKTGDAFLATIPVQWRNTVKKIANYEEDPTKAASMRGGNREQLTQWVNQVNPGYDAGLFTNRAPTRKAFTTGTQGQQINAINTAIGHIDQITGLAANLGNNSFVPGNKFYNWSKTTFGSDAVTNFDTLKDALSGEVASVLSKGSATVSGIAEAKDKIKSASSPAQLAGYVKTLLPIMGSKLNALDYQYHQAMGPDDPFSALSPEAKSILVKNGFNPTDALGSNRDKTGLGNVSTEELLKRLK